MLRFIRSALHMLFLTVTVIPWSLTVVALSPFVSKQTVTDRTYNQCS